MREEPEPGRAGRAMEETAAPGIKVVGGRLGRRAAGRQAGRQWPRWIRIGIWAHDEIARQQLALWVGGHCGREGLII